ncbi:MAG: hypothetical protein U0232_30275 [Thermomicrobiales bacterium]
MQATIGDYRIVARIDEGGMGAVFRAQHVSLGHEVAIKLLPTTPASDPTAQQWFRRGAAPAPLPSSTPTFSPSITMASTTAHPTW